MLAVLKIVIMTVVLLTFLGLGVPVVFILGGLSVIFTILFWGVPGLSVMVSTGFESATSTVLLAIPLFVFMGNIIRYTGIGDDMFDAVYVWMGRIKGGLAMGTVVICAIFAAMTGIAGAATVTMALIAIPSMASHGYDKSIYVGCVAAGGLLGLLIPPSIEMIIYSSLSGLSLGKMYLAGIFPGIIMAGSFILYIGVRCYFQPHLGPAITEKVSWGKKIKELKKMVLPVLLFTVILGGIYTGVFTATEASGIASAGALAIGALKRTLTWEAFKVSAYKTLNICGMVFWLIIGASVFSHTLAVTGIAQSITNLAGQMIGAKWGIIIGINALIFILGMVMEDLAITLLLAPICVPIMETLGVNQLWWGTIFCINIIIAWLTPPYGFNLFMMRLLVPEGVNMGDIYRSVIPFVCVMLSTLILVMIFPELALYLPRLLIGGE